ncbi:MAG: hypothetical protein ACKVLN_04740, partial [Rhodobacterales bacterium]
ASAGVLSHSGIKIPYFTFFAHDSGLRPKEAPVHMQMAMGITAFLCIGIGVYPDPLYALLPYPVEYHPYTTAHVVGQMQLLCFALLAFAVLMRTGFHPPEIRAINLDTCGWRVWAHLGGAGGSIRAVSGGGYCVVIPSARTRDWRVPGHADRRNVNLDCGYSRRCPVGEFDRVKGAGRRAPISQPEVVCHAIPEPIAPSVA